MNKCILCDKEKEAGQLRSAIVNGKKEWVCIGHGMTSIAAFDEIVGQFPVTKENYHLVRRARIYTNKTSGGATVSKSSVGMVFNDGSWGFRGSTKDYKSILGATKALRKYIDNK